MCFGTLMDTFNLILIVTVFSTKCCVMCDENISALSYEPMKLNNHKVVGQVSNIQSLTSNQKNETEQEKFGISSENMVRNLLLSNPIHAQDVNHNFRPSVHLGGIKDQPCNLQLRKSQPTPFNQLTHLQFDNSIEPEKGTVVLHPHQLTTSQPVKFVQDTDSRYVPATPVAAQEYHHDSRNPYHQSYHQEGYTTIDAAAVQQVPSHIPQVQHSLPIVQQPTPAYYEPEQYQHHHQYVEAPGNPAQSFFPHGIKPENMEPGVHYQYTYNAPGGVEGVVDVMKDIVPISTIQQPHQDLSSPHHHHQDISSSHHHHQDLPSPHHHHQDLPSSHHHHLELPSSHHNIQDLPSSHHHLPPNHEISGFYDGEIINKPGTVVYVTSHRQTSITKTRKFPYKFYQPVSDTGVSHSLEHGHAFTPQPKPASTWHKIFHLIGAFLPLGLLIAALKPPIIKINGNATTKPDIVLSKYRPINQLPLEHRSLGAAVEMQESEEDACENKSICELILQGASENADFAHKLLWNFSDRWTEEEARRNGLEDLFKAVKKKNCSTIKC